MKHYLKNICLILLIVYPFTCLLHDKSWAQTATLTHPKSVALSPLSSSTNPLILQGLTLYPDNPFKLSFIIDTGDEKHQPDTVQRKEIEKVIRYFLACLTIPDSDQWVNLSPHEPDRIINKKFGQTQMGIDLLQQDYVLKKSITSLMNPKKALGENYWDKIYTQVKNKFGLNSIPHDIFNKTWIIPDHAKVEEHDQSVLIRHSQLKVLTESDFLSINMNSSITNRKELSEIHKLYAKVFQEIIIPELEKEIHQGQQFAPLRQIYHSMILASWFKRRFKDNIFHQALLDKKITNGIDDVSEDDVIAIYNNYLKTISSKDYNTLKEDYDPETQTLITRKYISGGIMNRLDRQVLMTSRPNYNSTSTPDISLPDGSKAADLYLKPPKGLEKKSGKTILLITLLTIASIIGLQKLAIGSNLNLNIPLNNNRIEISQEIEPTVKNPSLQNFKPAISTTNLQKDEIKSGDKLNSPTNTNYYQGENWKSVSIDLNVQNINKLGDTIYLATRLKYGTNIYLQVVEKDQNPNYIGNDVVITNVGGNRKIYIPFSALKNEFEEPGLQRPIKRLVIHYGSQYQKRRLNGTQSHIDLIEASIVHSSSLDKSIQNNLQKERIYQKTISLFSLDAKEYIKLFLPIEKNDWLKFIQSMSISAVVSLMFKFILDKNVAKFADRRKAISNLILNSSSVSTVVFISLTLETLLFIQRVSTSLDGLLAFMLFPFIFKTVYDLVINIQTMKLNRSFLKFKDNVKLNTTKKYPKHAVLLASYQEPFNVSKMTLDSALNQNITVISSSLLSIILLRKVKKTPIVHIIKTT